MVASSAFDDDDGALGAGGCPSPSGGLLGTCHLELGPALGAVTLVIGEIDVRADVIAAAVATAELRADSDAHVSSPWSLAS
jgi:hypothetical protein